jgi:hypothetical protein
VSDLQLLEGGEQVEVTETELETQAPDPAEGAVQG